MTGLTLLGRDDQTVRVALDGRVMAQGLGDLRWRLPQMLAGGTETLVVDVAEVDRLSSTAIATLLWVKRSCAARRVRVVLSRPSDHTARVLKRTGLDAVLEIES